MNKQVLCSVCIRGVVEAEVDGLYTGVDLRVRTRSTDVRVGGRGVVEYSSCDVWMLYKFCCIGF